jgi:hypothetical protein
MLRSTKHELGNKDASRICDALHAFGIEPARDSVTLQGGVIKFKFAHPQMAHPALQNTSLFAEGPLGILHQRHVGKVATEYRSYRAGVGYSLHIVLGRDGSVCAHLDRYNPYEGPVDLALHGLFELLPYLAAKFLRMFRWRRGDGFVQAHVTPDSAIVPSFVPVSAEFPDHAN